MTGRRWAAVEAERWDPQRRLRRTGGETEVASPTPPHSSRSATAIVLEQRRTCLEPFSPTRKVTPGSRWSVPSSVTAGSVNGIAVAHRDVRPVDLDRLDQTARRRRSPGPAAGPGPRTGRRAASARGSGGSADAGRSATSRCRDQRVVAHRFVRDETRSASARPSQSKMTWTTCLRAAVGRRDRLGDGDRPVHVHVGQAALLRQLAAQRLLHRLALLHAAARQQPVRRGALLLAAAAARVAAPHQRRHADPGAPVTDQPP